MAAQLRQLEQLIQQTQVTRIGELHLFAGGMIDKTGGWGFLKDEHEEYRTANVTVWKDRFIFVFYCFIFY